MSDRLYQVVGRVRDALDSEGIADAPLEAVLVPRDDGGLHVDIYVGEGAPAGRFAGEVVLKGEVPGEEKIVIPVRGEVEGGK